MKEYITELGCFLWYSMASILGTVIKIKNPKMSNKKTILIVSGVGAQPPAFIFLKHFLERRDFSVYFLDTNLLEHFGIGFSSLDEIAQRISLFVKENNLTNITLLGMSAGALPSLLFLEKYDGWKYTKKFITLSGAFKGGWMSRLFPFIPFSQYNDSLRYPERMVSLFGTWDEFVSSRSSQLPGVRQVKLQEGGHAYLQTFSQKTFETIAKEAE